MKNKLNGVYFIKTFAFLTIFLLHIEKISGIMTNNIAKYGVYLFIILSGFLMMYNYEDKIEEVNYKSIKDFVQKKIKKFYPLFLVTIIIKAPVSIMKYYYEFGGVGFNFFFNTFLRLLSSLFLVQAFIPDKNFYFAFNGVSWFLDVLFFCYIFTPFIIKKISNNSNKKNIIILFIIIILQIVFQILIDKYINNDYWYYIFPPYRLFDYIVGMLLCKIMFSREEKKASRLLYTMMEISIILISVTFYYYDLYNCDALVYILSIYTIYVFISNKGLISLKMNSFNSIRKICNINIELFLIHQPVIRYIEYAYEKFNNKSLFLNIIISIITFIIVFAICNLYNKKITNKKDKENKKWMKN